MRLTIVLSAVNSNPSYYLFVPKQIRFWGFFGIKFIAVFVGDKLPPELEPYRDHIVLWRGNSNLHSAYVAQNIRLYYPALLQLPEDELVMITDMDMLPLNTAYFTAGLEAFTVDDFIHYRKPRRNEILMCYNAAHPRTWARVLGISSVQDVERALVENYARAYSGRPGSRGWYTDQRILYSRLIGYPRLRVLNRPLRRLEMGTMKRARRHGFVPHVGDFDDGHFHRNYFANESFILAAEQQLAACTGYGIK